jgi:hypothetical protein
MQTIKLSTLNSSIQIDVCVIDMVELDYFVSLEVSDAGRHKTMEESKYDCLQLQQLRLWPRGASFKSCSGIKDTTSHLGHLNFTFSGVGLGFTTGNLSVFP